MPYVLMLPGDIDMFAREIDMTDELDEASRFGGRLSAMVALENRFGKEWKSTGWRPVRLEDVVVKPKPLPLGDFKLHISDPLEAVRRVAEWHNAYCERVEAWLLRATGKIMAFNRPECRVAARFQEWAGIYMSAENACVYPLAYAMMAPDFKGKAVAHEVCHGYQKYFSCGRGHGGDFYALMEHAAGEPISKHTHDYSLETARELTRSVLPWWQQNRAKGLLASLPCQVETEKKKRKGIR